jgi:hypothetical protein
MVEAVQAAGLEKRTDVVVVSDHGFQAVHHQLQLNFVFRQAGLLDVDEDDHVRRWDVAVWFSVGLSPHADDPLTLLATPRPRSRHGASPLR